jgi:dUTP pyrophosphatase
MTFLYARMSQDVVRPRRKHVEDAGVDVFAAETVLIWPFQMVKVRTGVSVQVPEGTALFVWPKSGGNHVLGAGVIDAGYQGEVLVKVLNYRPWPLVIKKGDPVAQLVMTAVVGGPELEVPLQELHKAASARGTTGGIHRE